jgi:hypothetical protein
LAALRGASCPSGSTRRWGRPCRGSPAHRRRCPTPVSQPLLEHTKEATATHRRVGTPYVNIGVGHRLAALVVDHLDGQRQGDAALVIRNVLPDLLSLHVWEGQRVGAPSRLRLDLHSGPWSTDGISMQAPASEKSVLRSIPSETVLLLLWSIRDTEM